MGALSEVVPGCLFCFVQQPGGGTENDAQDTGPWAMTEMRSSRGDCLRRADPRGRTNQISVWRQAVGHYGDTQDCR